MNCNIRHLTLACMACFLGHAWLHGAEQAKTKGQTAKKQASEKREPPKKTDTTKEKQYLTPAEVAEGLWLETVGMDVKVVWIEQLSTGEADAYAQASNYRLVGYSSLEKKTRVLLEKPGNYSRPLITPDGREVIYTDRRNTEVDGKFVPNPVMYRLAWDGGKPPVEVGPGFAVDVMRATAERDTWVYALQKLNADNRLAQSGRGLVRFPLNSPNKIEPVWDGADMGVDNLQVSRDGRRMVGLFPWPDAGLVDVPSGRRLPLTQGCWASLAPDNSGVMWVFDGTHRKVHLHGPDTSSLGELSFVKGPNLKGSKTYHPRWTNHPQWIVLTGPYPKKVVGSKVGESRDLRHNAEVLLAKLSPDLTRVVCWFRLTNIQRGDFYPDAWIEQGDEVVLKNFPQNPKFPAPPAAQHWPAVSQGLLYQWALSDADNQVSGRSMNCRATAKGMSRYSPRRAMLLDGGYFVADEGSNQKLAAAATQPLTVEFLWKEHGSLAAGASVRLAALSAGGRELEMTRTASGVAMRTAVGGKPASHWQARHALPEAAEAQETHLLLTLEAAAPRLFLDGQEVRLRPAPAPVGDPSPAPPAGLSFGGQLPTTAATTWLGELENAAIYTKILTPAEIERQRARSQSTAKSRKAPKSAPVRVLAKLEAGTTPDPKQLASYQRMLVDHRYTVTRVISGELPKEAKSVAVLHWAILDRQVLPGFPRTVGKQYELTLERMENRPEISSELQQIEVAELEDQLYLDLARPAAAEAPPQENP